MKGFAKMEINFDLYRVFCAVAKEKSLSAAAKKLYVSQSAVSQSIKQLETALDTKLFDRKSRGVSLTAEGEVLYKYAEQSLSLLENALEKFEELKDLKYGRVRIGASDTVCSLLLTDVLKKFHSLHPQIKIELTNDTTGHLISLLKQGEIDLAFVSTPLEDESSLVIKEVIRIHDCFVASGKYSSLADKTLTLEELCSYPLLTLDKFSSARKHIDSVFTQNGVSLKPDIELGSIDLLAKFALSGIGVSAVIEEYVTENIKDGSLKKLELDTDIPSRAFSLVTLENTTLSPAASKLCDLL